MKASELKVCDRCGSFRTLELADTTGWKVGRPVCPNRACGMCPEYRPAPIHQVDENTLKRLDDRISELEKSLQLIRGFLVL